VKFTKSIHRAVTNEAEQKKYEAAMSKWSALTDAEKGDTTKNPVPVAPNPPMLAQVVNLTTGEINQIIVGSILQSELEREFPEHGYVGRGFQIRKSKIQGKRYAAYQIAELELDGSEGEAGHDPQPAHGDAEGETADAPRKGAKK
jgi:hypothetical protein